jgi:hypothetical protein
MLFSVKITSEDGEIIEIGKDDVENEKNLIQDIEIHMDTVNNDVRQKSNAMLAKIKIHGSMKPIIKDELLKLFNWSKALTQDKWYRTIEIKIKTDLNTVSRNYILQKVFVVDYIEFYKNDDVEENSSADYFELYLTQQENNFKTIESF